MGNKIIFSAILVYGTLFVLATAEPVDDKRALLDFIGNISHSRNLNWDERTSACNSWTGVTCNHDRSKIIAVRLPAIGFKGRIPPNTLSRLVALQILSLRSNDISGPFPSDLLKLGNLTGLYLQFNNFQGPLPLDFSVWKNLSVLNLSNNDFNGSIPSSISSLTHLTALDLANNSLSGDVPDLNIPTLQLLDLSNNNLTGVVPQTLVRFPSSAFSGNNVTLQNLPPPVLSPTAVPKKHSWKFSEPAILGIVIGSCAAAFILIALLLIVTYRKKKDDKSIPGASQKKEKLTKRMASEHQDENGRVIFFEGCNLVFDLEDLLRASAEVLGKGAFGTTYIAALEDSTTVAVKRLKEVIVGKKDFEQQMEVVGNIRHENVAPLRAYYYSKDEKLMVYDYYNQGSMSALLHAKRGEDRIPLNWETRVKIAIGAAKGIAHIHSQCGGKLVHGNIKASNIFLNSQLHGCVSDLGLATLMSPIAPPVMRTAGYRAPEITDTRKVSQPSDVYSFGVLLLELLTGKSPVHASGGEEVIHLVRWVHSVVREEWTGEVFDVELLRYPNIEEEMVAMLQIGLSCVARMPEQRPKIGEVVKMLEEIRSSNTDNSPSAGTRSPGSTPALTPYVGEIGPSSVHT
ncbi:probable inactive receptor kinase At4g23740 [Sesamum indicum]|uniref:Probable Inactive receptor kinase At4g23740 n=1 Tax=Sesamum indicum TaxID=4182 RepID=A0A6I9SYX8_SESIN|nr:probable inactive receptor kinase At4g23740 [Sesamum indicum]XP_011076042.1 probable inactive receptor kinase At4g23740 [Sesamum indicum]XP_011076043.1 probable inactive receptor kinase At4g23740 [Sesamum indicum]XP_011076044.1 probable inactive receptor kinase At4g23740 [Sesamum indicum]